MTKIIYEIFYELYQTFQKHMSRSERDKMATLLKRLHKEISNVK
jgi:hypothetical protein